MKKRCILMCSVLVLIVAGMCATAFASHVVSTSSTLDGDCDVTFRSSISDNKQYAYAQTVTNQSSANTSVSATFYYLDTGSGFASSSGNGSGGFTQCGVGLTLYRTQYFFKVVSTHTVYYHSLNLSRRDMVNQVFP